MAGRPRKPLEVIKGNGRSKHLTKAVMKEREEQENALRGNCDNIEPPSYLTKTQKEEFVNIANELLRLNIFSNLDIDSLARYIDSRHEYIKVTKVLRTMKPIDLENKEKYASDDYAKVQRVKNLLFNECKAAASDLGLTITSRLKLIIPKSEDDDNPESDFDREFGGV